MRSDKFNFRLTWFFLSCCRMGINKIYIRGNGEYVWRWTILRLRYTANRAANKNVVLNWSPQKWYLNAFQILVLAVRFAVYCDLHEVIVTYEFTRKPMYYLVTLVAPSSAITTKCLLNMWKEYFIHIEFQVYFHQRQLIKLVEKK